MSGRNGVCLMAGFMLATIRLSYAQGYYPLEAGNVWQYYEEPGHYYGWTNRAIGDTLMPNGLTYKILSRDSGFQIPDYIRQTGSTVYEYRQRAPNVFDDHLLYDFSKRSGDTVLVEYTPRGDTIVTILANTIVAQFYGRPLRLWSFVTDSYPNRFLIVRNVIDSVGLAYLLYEPGLEYFLSGAIIRGTQYGTITDVQLSSEVPTGALLFQNYPNPFNPSTSIRYDVSNSTFVNLSVFDILGRRITVLVDRVQHPGSYDVTFSGDEYPSGVYYYRLLAENRAFTRKMILQK